MIRDSSLVRLFIAAAIIAAFLWGWQSQSDAPAGAPQTEFSTSHAFATLAGLLREQIPHPSGSVENRLVKDRIVAELKSYGYEPEIQSTFQCSPPSRAPGCTQVENILAVRKGGSRGKAILATAHYDSVPAGPGVADDGAGTAVMLELARVLKSKPLSRNDVIFLFTDGEETGLRGAVAFAEQNPLMKSVALVVNVESRGDTGPSIMFETGPGNSRLIGLFADAAPLPVSNSLAYEIYRLLPNDTDFSIYKRHGLSGFNFAMIGSASRYHSPRDDLAHLDHNTLQHHGDHAFALVSRLLDEDLDALKSASDASYFDVFGRMMLVWPSALNLPLSLLGLFGIFGLLVKYRAEFSFTRAGFAALALTTTLVMLYALGWVLSLPLAIWPGAHPLDHPSPWPARTALLSGAMLVAALVPALLGSRVKTRALLLVNWLLLSILATVCAATLPGAAYALMWPALVFAISGWAEARTKDDSTLKWSAAIGFAAIAFFWTSHFVALDAVFGFNLSQFKLVALAPLTLALAPLLAAGQGSDQARSAIVATAAILIGATLLSMQAHGFSSDHPRPLNFVYYDDRDFNQPKWLVTETPVDETFMRAAGFSPADQQFKMLGVYDAHGRLKPAVNANLDAPSLTFESISSSKGRTSILGSLRSARAGFVMGIAVPAGSGIKSISVEGQSAVDEERLAGKDPVGLRLFAVGDRALKVQIEFDPLKPSKIVLFERSPLPDTAEARQLLASRPADSAQVHSGDGSMVFRQMDLNALKPTSAAPGP